MLCRLICLLVFAALLPFSAWAQLRLPRLFTNGAVLQREVPLPVWGQAAAGATVSVALNGVSGSTQAGADGAWRLDLPAMPAGGPYTMTIAAGAQTTTLQDVYVGDVWLASGQSNMEWTVGQTTGAAATIAAANDPRIRQFKVPKALASEPAPALPASSAWTPATRAYVGSFSGVAYFFARALRESVDVPIGILNVSYGGSRIETWMSDALLGYDEQTVTLAGGEPERQPTLAYNAMLHPLLPFAIKGFLWYQGESNADNMEDALAYGAQFQTLIAGWRALWGRGDLPFLWVQLPNFGSPSGAQPSTWDAWPRLRAGQDAALALPNTGQAVAIDVGGTDIHPPDKEPVGRRLALVARHVAYGQDVVYSGPRYRGNTLREDGRVVLHFSQMGGGLVGGADGHVGSIALAGADGRFVWADAQVEGDNVVAWSSAVPAPQTVRYAWEYNPADANLYNAEGLPAAPFEAPINPGFKIALFSAARTALEMGQTTTLSWRVYGAAAVTLDGAAVDSTGTLPIAPVATKAYTLRATSRDSTAVTDSATVTVEVLDPDLINRALGRPATASTVEACCGSSRLPALAVDGDPATRWSSAWSDGSTGTPADPNLDDDPGDEWIALDLGAAVDLERLILTWEAAYAAVYDIEVSYDGYRWTGVFHEAAGSGGEDNLTFSPAVGARFVRVHGRERGTPYGYSLYEIAAYGALATRQPPTVEVGTAMGNVVAAGATVTFTAQAADADGTVQTVAFFADGVPLGTSSAAPFQATWTATAGTHHITALATDDAGLQVQSAPFVVYVTGSGAMTRYEAEGARTTGQAIRTNAAAASGGAYLEMRDGWTITWPGVTVPEAGTYLLSIGYQLTFESPKSQYLVVNGDTVETVAFTAPNTAVWLQRGLPVALRAGANEIAIHGFWNWMSFDFIAVGNTLLATAAAPSAPVEGPRLTPGYPNPFATTTTLGYVLSAPEHVRLDVFDVMGRRVARLVDGVQAAGTFQVAFQAAGLASGVYVCRLEAGALVQTQTLTVLR